jgi:hypothetical protein
MFAFALNLLDLTLWEVVSDIPHDFAALVTYVILVLFIAGIWYGSRGRAGSDGGTGTGRA